MSLKYRVDTVSRGQIHSHLEQCDGSFVPSLSSRVKLLDYSNRLFEKSTCFEAWEGSVLVGMVNAYLHDVSDQTGFVTNVSVVKEHMGKGVATTLLSMCVEHARGLSLQKIELEVSKENNAAIRLYLKAGFNITEEAEGKLLMEHEIHR